MLAITGYARDLERGYRGFIDWDNAIGSTYYPTQYKGHYGHADLWFIGLATTHGYQFTPNWYVGGGLLLSTSFPSYDKMLPIYADVRYDGKFGKVTPYIDLRAGYYYDGAKSGGLYLSPTLGYSFQMHKKLNFNLGVGITVRGFTRKFYKGEGIFLTQSGSETTNYTFIAARFGIDFK